MIICMTYIDTRNGLVLEKIPHLIPAKSEGKQNRNIKCSLLIVTVIKCPATDKLDKLDFLKENQYYKAQYMSLI